MSGVLAGIGAAAAGLLILAALIGVAWILEPAVGGSVLGPARLSVQAWLLAHGADIAAGGVVVAVTPLGLMAVAGLCCWHAGSWAGRRAAVSSLREVGAVVVALALTYTAIGAGLTLLGSTDGASIGLVSMVPGVLGLSTVAGAGGVLRAAGHGRLVHDRLAFPSRAVLSGVCAGAALLGAAGVTTLGITIAVDGAGFAALTERLAPGWTAGLGLFILSLLLLPNAALYAVAVLLGPGFAVGAGTTVSAFGVSLAQVPGLPLVAGLPDQPAVPLGAFLALVIPGLSGLAVGAVVARRVDDLDDLDGNEIGPLLAGGWAAVAGLTLAVGLGVAQWLAGGSLGEGALAMIGAPPLATTIAAAGFLTLPAALSAGVLRRRYLRNR